GLETPGLDVLMLSETDALGRKTSYRYDSLGNVIQRTIDTGTITDPTIQPVQGAANGGQVTTKYTYDPLFSKMTSKTDADGHTTFYLIDSPVPFAQDTGMPPPLPGGATLPAPTGHNTGDLLPLIAALCAATR